jgi:GNAT superfamily N-acetyltransferase
MTRIERYRPEDRRQVEALYRRVFGADAALANQLRWQWQYAQNPGAPPPAGPAIWLAREAQTVVGQYATIPVRVSVLGQEIDAAWGTDVMVAPERQRQGLGDELLRAWDREAGASLGLGLSDSSRGLLAKMRWPHLGPLTALVKPLSRRAFRVPSWPVPVNRFVSYVTLPIVRRVARPRPLAGEVRTIRHFDDRFTALWDRIAGRFAFAVRRDAAYLNWKFIQPPHVRYIVAALERDSDNAGYAVYRHVAEPLGRVTRLVDFLTDPDDAAGFLTLLRWVDREARAADSDKIRTWVSHDAFRRLLRKSGYFAHRSSVELVAKVNAVDVPADYYQSPDAWHVTLGDADQDR